MIEDPVFDSTPDVPVSRPVAGDHGIWEFVNGTRGFRIRSRVSSQEDRAWSCLLRRTDGSVLMQWRINSRARYVWLPVPEEQLVGYVQLVISGQGAVDDAEVKVLSTTIGRGEARR